MNFHLDMPRVPDLLKNCSNDEPYKNVSYDVESLFTSIPVQEMKDHILQRFMFVRKLNLFAKNQYSKN